MGQSVAEQAAAEPLTHPLTDPLDGAMGSGDTPPAVADGHADDLLSQLAGAEIDRMLAEADVEPDAPVPPAVTPVAAAPAEPTASVPVEPSPSLPASPIAAAQNEAAAAPSVPTPSAPPSPGDLDAVLADAAAERSALRTPPAPALDATDANPSAALDLGAPLARLPLALRPLALLNAPLDEYPDRVREAIGKVALVTLVNAVAVIAYVLIFRRHG